MSSSFSDVQTEEDAIELIRELIFEQLEAAARDQPPLNQSITGDAAVRRAFWKLLNPARQRLFFLDLIKNRAVWPRLRSLIGIPPFSFLRAQDDSVLNASGIANSRLHMAALRSTIASSSEIGQAAHFIDDAERTFKLVAVDTDTPQILVRRAANAKKLVFDMRLALMKREDRLLIAKQKNRSQQRSISFPRPGERLLLTPHESFGLDDGLMVTVRTVESRARASPVARLYCVR